jgi:hypothetical protein
MDSAVWEKKNNEEQGCADWLRLLERLFYHGFCYNDEGMSH